MTAWLVANPWFTIIVVVPAGLLAVRWALEWVLDKIRGKKQYPGDGVEAGV